MKHHIERTEPKNAKITTTNHESCDLQSVQTISLTAKSPEAAPSMITETKTEDNITAAFAANKGSKLRYLIDDLAALNL